MKPYLDLLRHVFDHGAHRPDRTGTGTRSVFGAQMRFDLAAGFPAVTTKKLYFRSVVHELLWFLRGETNVRSLNDAGVHIWDAWADEDGDLGPVYGAQWRSWRGADGRTHDQIAEALRLIRQDPFSRRIIVSAWNVGELDAMRLPPCHLLFQFYVSAGDPRRLSCHLYQRSADMFLGVPFNIASYAALTHLMAMESDLGVGEFVHTIGDAHIYENHVDAVSRQLGRTPLEPPKLWVSPEVRHLDAATMHPDHFRLDGYRHAPSIRAPIAV